MSRWTAPSDYDYLEEQRGVPGRVERTCSRCGAEAWVPRPERHESYQVYVLCDRCEQLAERHTVPVEPTSKQGAA